MYASTIAELMQTDREYLFDAHAGNQIDLPTMQDVLPPVQARLLREFFGRLSAQAEEQEQLRVVLT